MKKFIVTAIMLCCVCAAIAGPRDGHKTVVYKTDLDCANCVKKITENVSFEKGVKDLKAELATQEVTIVFDPAKTDTLKLGNAIRKLGYSAKAISLTDTPQKK